MMPGKPVSEPVFADLVPRIEALRAAGHNPGLGTILVGDDGASAGYIRMKMEKAEELGFGGSTPSSRRDATQADVVTAIRAFNDDPTVDAMLLQHPTPPHIDYDAALPRSTRTRTPTAPTR